MPQALYYYTGVGVGKKGWKPRREFKIVEDKRAIKKAASKLADVEPQEFERDLKDLEVKDMFAAGAKVLKGVGGVEKIAHDATVLMLEWSIKYADLSPYEYLMQRRHYSKAQTDKIISLTGGIRVWETEKIKVLDKMSESVIKRHIDKMVEVNDQHIAASKLTLAKAIEMLSKLPVDTEAAGEEKGKTKKKALRSIDLTNIANAIQTAQKIYRTAMGIPNEESGMAQILEKVAQIQTTNIQNNIQVNVQTEKPKSQAQKSLEELGYDDVMEFIEYRREQKKLAQGQQPNVQQGGSNDDKQRGTPEGK